jgi:endoribonuclease L-PSP
VVAVVEQVDAVDTLFNCELDHRFAVGDDVNPRLSHHQIRPSAPASMSPGATTIALIRRRHLACRCNHGGNGRQSDSEQTRQCLTNVQAILEEAGSSMARAVSFTVVLADEDDFSGMNEDWLRWFPSDPPARQGAKLPARIPGLKISIAAIAAA